MTVTYTDLEEDETMHLLIEDTPLQVLPLLANEVGLNGAIFLQQLHFRSLISKNVRDGYVWVYKTYGEWKEEFTFWSLNTIKRIIYELEEKGFLCTTSVYNKMRNDNTKWYRIDYTKLTNRATHSELVDSPKQAGKSTHTEPINVPIMSKPITKELKTIKTKELVEMNLDAIHSVINHLNLQANKQFKAHTAATQKAINARLKEGYTLDDFKRVIDLKVSQWLHDPRFHSYLRPSTLFNPTNFENYLNESPAAAKQKVPRKILRPPVLDFNRGER